MNTARVLYYNDHDVSSYLYMDCYICYMPASACTFNCSTVPTPMSTHPTMSTFHFNSREDTTPWSTSAEVVLDDKATKHFCCYSLILGTIPSMAFGLLRALGINWTASHITFPGMGILGVIEVVHPKQLLLSDLFYYGHKCSFTRSVL